MVHSCINTHIKYNTAHIDKQKLHKDMMENYSKGLKREKCDSYDNIIYILCVYVLNV